MCYKMVSKLLKEWETKKLSDFVNFIKGKKPKEFVSKDAKYSLPYILISSFTKETQEYFSNDATCKKCYADDVLIVWDGARAGLCSQGHEGYIGSTIVAIRQKEKLI